MKRLILILGTLLITVLLFGCVPKQKSLTGDQQKPLIVDRDNCIQDACGDGVCGNIEFKSGLCPKDCDNQIGPNESTSGRECTRW
jgi:hypothetical protein